MEYQFYLSPQVGTGSRLDPYRSKIAEYLKGNDTGQNYWDWIHPDRPVRYGLVYADAAVHDHLAADSQIVAMSPRLPDVAAADAWLANPGTSLPPALQSLLRLDGCAPDQAPPGSTLRDLWSQLRAMHVTHARAQRGEMDAQGADAVRMWLGPLEF